MVKIRSKAMKFEDTTLIFQSIKPKKPAVTKVVKNALRIGRITNQIFPKNKYSMTAKTKATAEPNTTRSDFI